MWQLEGMLGLHGASIWFVLGALFLATFVRAALGFGEALIAVPLLIFVIPVQIAAPLSVLTSVTVSSLVLLKDWREVQVVGARRLVLSTFLGVPLGLALLLSVNEALVKAWLALVIISFALYNLLGRTSPSLHDDCWAWPFGFLAGVLGGAYGMNGPPLVIYGALRGWPAVRFRATLQGYFLPASLASLIGYACAGLWGWQVTFLYLATLPVIVLATWLGSKFHNGLAQERFLALTHLALLGVGALLLWQSAYNG